MRRRAERAAASLLAVLLAACGSAPPPPNAAEQRANTLAASAARTLARGDVAHARTQYEAALAAAESVEDFDLAGALLLNLALVHQRAGELAAAQARVDRILAAPQHFGAALQADAAARKALLFVDAAYLDAALRWADRAGSLCAAPCALDAALADLRAFVALQRGDASGAASQAQRATAAAVPQSAEQANALRLLGRAQTRLGRPDDAAASLAQALAIDRHLGLPERVALDLLDAAENERSRAQLASARDFYERARTVYRASGQQREAERVQQQLEALPAAN